jgi:Uroporphyrinogen decarboxylase (URO-D)
MSGSLHPRQVLRELLQGVAPSRPLFLPIVFQLGSKIENLPQQSYLANPTKIASALRQIRGYLRADGVSCYFDPHLELEALGASLQWGAIGEAPGISWRGGTSLGQLPSGLRSVEEAAKTSRVAVAVDVIQRLKSMLRDDSLLMAGLTGPFSLAARLTGQTQKALLSFEDLPAEAIELSASLLGNFARTLAEAGANVVFIQEDFTPLLSGESLGNWAGLLEPVCNVIRFFESLPILLLTDKQLPIESLRTISRRSWNCVVGVPLSESMPSLASVTSTLSPGGMAIAIPSEQFSTAIAATLPSGTSIRETIRALRPAVVTTTGDVPITADPKLIMQAGLDILSP